MTEVYTRRNGIGAGNPANQIAGEQGKFHQAITGAFHNGKKSSFDRPNYTSIQVFHFKISFTKKRSNEIRFDKNIFAQVYPIRRLRVARKPV